MAGLAVGGVGLFIAGGLASLATTVSWWFSGLRQLAFGAWPPARRTRVGLALGVGVIS